MGVFVADTAEAVDRSVWAEFIVGMPARMAQRRNIVRLLRQAPPVLVGSAVLLQLAAGLLPAGFVLATAAVVAAVPAVIEQGVDSAAWSHLRADLVGATVLFFGIQLLQPVQAFVGELLRRQIDDQARDRLMADAFATGGVSVLEDPEVLDHAANGANMLRVSSWTPGAAAAGLIALISHYLQALSAAVVVGVAFSWWAAPMVLSAGLIIRFGYRLGLSVFGRVFRGLSRVRRRCWYFRGLLMKPDAAKEIRVFGLLDWIKDQYESAATEAVRPVWRQRRRIFYGPYVVYTSIAFVLLGIVLGDAARSASQGVTGVGAFLIVMQAGLSAVRIGAFIASSDVQTEFGMAADHAQRQFGEMIASAARKAETEASDAVPAGPTAVPTGFPLRAIRFEQVTFAYPGTGRPILDRLDLVIPAGRSLAIVGLNGAGKTTLVKLLARLYEPDAGRITVDDVDIRSFPVADWQRCVAAIFQDFVKFELPVRENVGFGAAELLDRPDGGDEAVRSALERAGALAFVDALPRGLDTPLSRQYTDGVDLSGGQWQRIATARALLAVEGGARMLVLDEPTANLDARAEVAFFERFLDLTDGVTSVVISHRFSTVRRADRIAVLEHGTVLEEGTHGQLISRGGRYAELFELQSARFATTEGAHVA
jgi:ATP-binding cassette, subfamily B, bacterial